MSQWLHLNSGRVNQVMKDLESARMMGGEFGNVDPREVVNILNGAKQELLKLENEKNELLKENRELKSGLRDSGRTTEEGNDEN